jgi:hypothetical protein
VEVLEKIHLFMEVCLLLMELQVDALFYLKREMSAYIESEIWLQLLPP